jgi:pimeloyl-ACP methyl ester carboxylesterase
MVLAHAGTAVSPTRRRRRVALGVTGGALLAIVTLGVVNAVVVSSETKPARADIGWIADLPGGQIQLRVDGPARGSPIVLIHRLGSSMHEWEAITRMLASHHRVIRVDLLGHGGSAKPSGGYSIENQARLVAEALRELDVTHALVVGHSMGGAVAVALARLDPRAVSELVLMDSNNRSRFFHLPTLAVWAPRPVIGETLWSLVSDSMIRNGLRAMFAPGYPVPKEAVLDLRRMTYTSYTESLREFERYLGERGLDRRLAMLTIPRMVIWGLRDQLVSDGALELYKQIPRVKIVTMPRSGHSPMIEEPRKTAAELLAFLAATSVPQSTTTQWPGARK